MNLSTKERILDSAVKVFFEKGFEETTMKDIAKSAGLTQPATYIYFKNKMDLLKEVCLWSAQASRVFTDKFISDMDTAELNFQSYVHGNLLFFNTEKYHAHSMMALYYFSLTHPEVFEAFKLVHQIGIRRITSFLIRGSNENTWNGNNLPEKAEAIHSYLIGQCYKSIYFITTENYESFKLKTWKNIRGIIAGA